MLYNEHSGSGSFGRVKRIAVIVAILAFVAFQSVLIYGFVVARSYALSAAETPRPAAVTRTASEEVIAKKILSAYDAFDPKKLRSFMSLSDKDSKSVELVKVNASTIENMLISVLDPAAGSSIESFIFNKKILFSESYSFRAMRNCGFILKIYSREQLRAGDTAKASAAIRAMFSLSLVAQKGFEGQNPIIAGMIAIVIKKMAAEAVISASRNVAALSPQERLSIATHIKKCIPFYMDIFDMLEGERRCFTEQLLSEILAPQKAGLLSRMVNAAAFGIFQAYFGDIKEHYEKLIADIIATRGKGYSETKRVTSELMKKLEKYSSSPLAMLRSEINPVVLIAIPNFGRANEQCLYSDMMVNSALLSLALRDRADRSEKAPGSLVEFCADRTVSDVGGLSKDLFSGADLKYSLSSTGEVTLYTVGPDMKDDGGRFAEFNSHQTEGYDFRLL